MAVVAIDLEACINCGWCRRVCPTETIKYFATKRRTHVVEPDGCINCGICPPICPVDAIHPVEDYVVPADKLEAARAHAKGFAAKTRQTKLNREQVVQRTLARLAAGGAHA